MLFEFAKASGKLNLSFWLKILPLEHENPAGCVPSLPQRFEGVIAHGFIEVQTDDFSACDWRQGVDGKSHA